MISQLCISEYIILAMLKSEKLIAQLEKRFDPAIAGSHTIAYIFNVTGEEGGIWLLQIGNGKCQFVPQKELPDDPRIPCYITIDTRDLEMILDGRMTAMTATLAGMLAIKGDMNLAMLLVPMLFESRVNSSKNTAKAQA